jgi:hypothetical protein
MGGSLMFAMVAFVCNLMIGQVHSGPSGCEPGKGLR